jgi:hypothetical protein
MFPQKYVNSFSSSSTNFPVLGPQNAQSLHFALLNTLFLLAPVMYVHFVNAKFPFCSVISILFGKLDYFYFELCCITVTFPNVTLKNMSEQVQTQSKTEYWQF